jgi:hypothetical protein
LGRYEKIDEGIGEINVPEFFNNPLFQIPIVNEKNSIELKKHEKYIFPNIRCVGIFILLPRKRVHSGK